MFTPPPVLNMILLFIILFHCLLSEDFFFTKTENALGIFQLVNAWKEAVSDYKPSPKIVYLYILLETVQSDCFIPFLILRPNTRPLQQTSDKCTGALLFSFTLVQLCKKMCWFGLGKHWGLDKNNNIIYLRNFCCHLKKQKTFFPEYCVLRF